MNKELIELLEENIEVLYNSLMERPLQVLDIFNDFFGEYKVDMQGFYSLDDFKTWINEEPINTYIPETFAGISSSDWNLHNDFTLTRLPEDMARPIIKALNSRVILEKIGDSKFNRMFILVHFPHVRVTNEHNRFVDINHLWAKIKISYNGTMIGGFSLNRSEYTVLHIKSDYMHSHVSGIPFDDFSYFQSPCTGSGPINGTISTLNRDYDKDIWNMFCLELSKYVTVESIAGRPYHYLERLGTDDMAQELCKFMTYLKPVQYLNNSYLKEFTKYFISTKKLKFNYINGSFSIGMSFTEFIILISNEFIKWYNKQYNEGNKKTSLNALKATGILNECIIDNGRIYYEDESTSGNVTQYIGRHVCFFKGKQITVSISDITEINRNNNKSLIFNIQNSLYILSIILKVLNYRYGRNKAIQEADQTGTEVRYL